MTTVEFITNEVPSFEPGQLIVVSGPDLAAIYLLLMDARDAIQSDYQLDPIDTRATVKYPTGIVSDRITPTESRFGTGLEASNQYGGKTLIMLTGAAAFESSIIDDYDYGKEAIKLTTPLSVAPAVGDSYSIEPNPEKAYKFEYLALKHKASGSDPKIVLIGNQFDRDDYSQNPHPNTLLVDVMRDLILVNNVEHVPIDSIHRNYLARELLPYFSKVYYYDGETVTYLKDQLPERP